MTKYEYVVLRLEEGNKCYRSFPSLKTALQFIKNSTIGKHCKNFELYIVPNKKGNFK
jgi:hypothetical protein